MQESDSLKGRVVLVTGGGSGLGQALCSMLAGEGARVAVADIDERRAQQLAERLQAEGGDVMGCVMDVGVARDVQDGLDAVVRRFGRLDAVVNSAGIDVTAPIGKLDADVWERVLRTNLTGPSLWPSWPRTFSVRAATSSMWPRRRRGAPGPMPAPTMPASGA